MSANLIAAAVAFSVIATVAAVYAVLTADKALSLAIDARADALDAVKRRPPV